MKSRTITAADVLAVTVVRPASSAVTGTAAARDVGAPIRDGPGCDLDERDRQARSPSRAG